jgi:hypothetical protein
MEISSGSNIRSKSNSSNHQSGLTAKAPALSRDDSHSEGKNSEGVRKFIKNEKMLILDFDDTNLTSEQKIRMTRDCILQKTELIDFRLKTLERGGISVLFKTIEQKNFAESILKKELESSLKKKGYISSKKTFEVLLPRFPRELHLDLLTTYDHVVNYKQLRSTDVVLFMDSKEAATNLIQRGMFIDNYYFSISPFVFRPHILCGLCRKIGHNQLSCTERSKSSSLCINCAKDHDEDHDCSAEIRCTECSSNEHNILQCPTYQSQIRAATTQKMKSYKEALSIKPIPTPRKVGQEGETRVAQRKQPERIQIVALVEIILSTLQNLGLLKEEVNVSDISSQIISVMDKRNQAPDNTSRYQHVQPTKADQRINRGSDSESSDLDIIEDDQKDILMMIEQSNCSTIGVEMELEDDQDMNPTSKKKLKGTSSSLTCS